MLPAVILFGGLMVLTTTLAAPLGLAGGLILGAVNAVLIGATLSLVEQSVLGMRALGVRDILESFGQYFWDVMGVGFILWIPLMFLDAGVRANPYGGFLAAAVFLLLFLLLNPAPEVIYQIRHDSPLDVVKTSYEFVLDNWIEWFLPVAIVFAPLGLSFFLSLSGRLGRGVGLDFFQLLVLPFTLLNAWIEYLGFPEAFGSLFVFLLTPPLAVAILLFRGHLFRALRQSTSRQRRFGSELRK